MGDRVLWHSIFFLLYLFLIPDSSVADKPQLEAILQNRKLDHQENQIFSSSSKYTYQLDATSGNIPIINPTPTTTTPIVNPTIPPPPSTMTPIVNPDTPPSPTTMEPPTTPTPTPTTTTPTPTTTTPAGSGGAWCIASPTASETALQVALDYACGYGGADCSAIQPGGTCYNPNTLRDHASYAFDDYYQKNPVPTSCAFGGTAQLTYTDPSSGSCRYATPRTTPSISPPTIPTPTTPSSPTIYGTTPPSPTTYGSDPTGYGSEPTASPSSAESISCNLLLFFTATCLMVSLAVANYL